MILQYILLVICGALIMALLLGLLRRNFKDLLTVLFDLPDKSESPDEKGKAD